MCELNCNLNFKEDRRGSIARNASYHNLSFRIPNSAMWTSSPHINATKCESLPISWKPMAARLEETCNYIGASPTLNDYVGTIQRKQNTAEEGKTRKRNENNKTISLSSECWGRTQNPKADHLKPPNGNFGSWWNRQTRKTQLQIDCGQTHSGRSKR